MYSSDEKRQRITCQIVAFNQLLDRRGALERLSAQMSVSPGNPVVETGALCSLLDASLAEDGLLGIVDWLSAQNCSLPDTQELPCVGGELACPRLLGGSAGARPADL